MIFPHFRLFRNAGILEDWGLLLLGALPVGGGAGGGLRRGVAGARAGELGAGFGGLLLDLPIGLGLGDGVVQELQVVLVGDGGRWGHLSVFVAPT